MAGTISTLFAQAKTLDDRQGDNAGQQRHAVNELKDWQSVADPELGSDYVSRDNVNTIPAHTAPIASGNFVITLEFPKYDLTVVTGNVGFDSTAILMQAAINAAMAGQDVVSTYAPGDINVALTGNITANDATLTFNGVSVAGTYAVVTTQNVDLNVDNLGTPTVDTTGQGNRPCEALFRYASLVLPTGTPTIQGVVPQASQYYEGDGNPLSISPGLKDALLDEMSVTEDGQVSTLFRDLIGCV